MNAANKSVPKMKNQIIKNNKEPIDPGNQR